MCSNRARYELGDVSRHYVTKYSLIIGQFKIIGHNVIWGGGGPGHALIIVTIMQFIGKYQGCLDLKRSTDKRLNRKQFTKLVLTIHLLLIELGQIACESLVCVVGISKF